VAKRKSLFIRGTYFDYPSLFYVVFLVVFGLMMIYSASSYVADNTFGDGAYYLERQFIFSIMGILGMLALSRYRYQ
jgi:cell division protein FtsW